MFFNMKVQEEVSEWNSRSRGISLEIRQSYVTIKSTCPAKETIRRASHPQNGQKSLAALVQAGSCSPEITKTKPRNKDPADMKHQENETFNQHLG